jgi:hypothetical protein
LCTSYIEILAAQFETFQFIIAKVFCVAVTCLHAVNSTVLTAANIGRDYMNISIAVYLFYPNNENNGTGFHMIDVDGSSQYN